MNRDRRARLKEIFHEAAEIDDEQLQAFLAEACGDDRKLFEELEELIAFDRRTAADFLERPAIPALGLCEDQKPPPTVELEEIPEIHPPPVKDWERYVNLELLASGGMGDVYRAFDPRLKRHVALKFIRSPNRRQVERFLREAESQAKVEHDNVLEIYETGEVEGQRFIAMRYVDGPTLRETRGETTLEEKIRIMLQVAEALHAAHRQGLVHRDIKPANILMERTEHGNLKPYVMDFGIAASTEEPGLTTTGDLLGTPWYMAPERVSWGPTEVDRRSDVYSLGVTLYEHISGERPYDCSSPLEMLTRLKDSDPRPLRQVKPELPVDLETIVMKCLERDPNRRYASARAVAEDLDRYLDGQPIAARRATMTYRLLKRARRNRALVAVTAAAMVILVAMGVANLRAQRQARVREELARDFARRVQEIDHVMRMAHVAPLHDLREEKALVQDMMASVRERLEHSGLLGEGSGHFALGRGYMALGEYRRAREHLERAWTRGYRGPEVAFALGAVLGELYQQQVKEVERIGDRQQRERRRREIEAELRLPAIDYLRASGGAGGDSPEYVHALTAFYERRFDQALELSRAGYQRLPWLYEARKLEGDIYARMGLDSWLLGEVFSAITSSERALEAYQAATTVARSDGATYVEMCELGRSMMEVELVGGSGAVARFFESGLEACDRALATDPNLTEAHRLKANLFCFRADAAMLHGEDPRSFIEHAVRSAGRTLELRPNDVHSHLAVGNGWLAEARFERLDSRDSSRSLGLAVDAFQRAVEIDPSSARAHGRLGLALLDRVEIELAAARDPADTLRRAINALATTTSIDRLDVHAHEALGAAHLRLALHLETRGEDPLPSLDEAIAAFHEAVTINPDYAPGHLYLGECYRLQWQHELRVGIDHRASVKKSLEAYSRAAELKPESLPAQHGIAAARAALARSPAGQSTKTS